jgi:hypothetical protein
MEDEVTSYIGFQQLIFHESKRGYGCQCYALTLFDNSQGGEALAKLNSIV